MCLGFGFFCGWWDWGGFYLDAFSVSVSLFRPARVLALGIGVNFQLYIV